MIVADSTYGTFEGNILIASAPSPVPKWRFMTLKFRASKTTHKLRLINFDPAVPGDYAFVNGLMVMNYNLDPGLINSMCGWEPRIDPVFAPLDSTMPDITLTLDHTAPFPRDSAGNPFKLVSISHAADWNPYTSGVVFRKDDCVVGQTYRVLTRTVNPTMYAAIQQPIILMVDDAQIAWASDKIADDYITLWGTFTATKTTHDIKVANAHETSGGKTLSFFSGLEIVPVPDALGYTISSNKAPYFPAKIQQTLFPCQPWWHDHTVPQLVEQFLYMKDVGINELVMEQIINLGERRAYYDTGLKTPQTVVDPVSGQPITLPAITVYNDLVDRIIEAADIVGGIDLWWGIGRYWPWEKTPVLGSDVQSTTDPGVAWTWESWTTDHWGDYPHEHGSSAEALAANVYILDEIMTQYGPYIKGWYLPLEVESFGAYWQPNHPWFRTLFYEFTKMCLAKKQGIPVMVSPFYQDLVPPNTPDEYNLKKEYAQALIHCYLPSAKYALANGATKFIIAQQDGLGDVDREVIGSTRIYTAIMNALRISDYPQDYSNRIEVWHNIDLYDVHYNDGNPMAPTKLQAMMNSVNMLPKRTSFSFASQLTPQMPTRRPYWSAYRHYAKGRYAVQKEPFMGMNNIREP